MTPALRAKLTIIRDRLAEIDRERAAAMRVFAGVAREARDAGVPITEIARLTGVSRPTIYALLQRGTP